MRNGILSGFRNTDGAFYSRGLNAFLWSSSDAGSSAGSRLLVYGNATESRGTIDKSIGFSAIYKVSNTKLKKGGK